MKLIVAVDRNWGIGRQGRLLAHVREDMLHFRAYTAGKTVVYGSRTLRTFPGCKGLPKRRNIVLTRNPEFSAEGVETAASVEVLLRMLPEDTKDVVVIGGESVYRQLLPYCDEAEVTLFDKAYPADVWFPDLSADPAWERTHRGHWHQTDPATDSEPEMRYRFLTYRRIKT